MHYLALSCSAYIVNQSLIPTRKKWDITHTKKDKCYFTGHHSPISLVRQRKVPLNKDKFMRSKINAFFVPGLPIVLVNCIGLAEIVKGH